MINRKEYLDVTYSNNFGDYPSKLSSWIVNNYFKEKGSIADLGCGCGEYVKSFMNLGYDVCGLDISERSQELDIGKYILKSDFEKGETILCGESVDYVFSKSVLEHMKGPEKLTDETYRVLKSGGKCIFMVPSYEHTYWGAYQIDHTHVTNFTREALKNLMLMSGFKNVKVFYFYQLPIVWKYPIIKYVSKIISFLRIPYSPFNETFISKFNRLNKFIRFSREVMLFGYGEK